uniref:Protein TsetseEP domain-containing protein n=1 Tax=Anopheles culicifacies TaxID=139723 RepID=A0A2C9GUM0_9DIPT
MTSLSVSQLVMLVILLQTSTTTTTSSSTSPPIISQSANGLEISLGNRENTTSIGTDGGTNISNVEVNYVRELPLKYEQLFATLQEKAVSEIRTISAGTFAPDVWIETILEAYYRAANESRRDTLGVLNNRLIDLESYAEDVAAMLDRIRIAFGIELNQRLLTLDVTVLRCTQGQAVDATAKKVFQGNSDCVEVRLERVRNAQQEATHNMSRKLVEWDEEYLRAEIASCLEDGTDTIWSDNDYQLACISKILHEVHRKTLLMSYTAQQLTMEARNEFGTAKADMLQCAGDLVDQAKESLDDISVIISECQKPVSEQEVSQPTERS